MLGQVPIWPTTAQIKNSMPECFKTRYPKTRVILDCTEIRVQRPSSKVLNSEFYSAYKSHTTLKCLVGIALHGAVTFVSSLLGKYIRQRDNKMQWIFWPVGGRMDGSWGAGCTYFFISASKGRLCPYII